MANVTSAAGAEGCYLSVHDRAISTILASGVGSIILTVVHGPAVAFFVGWNCYFGVVRICLVAAADLLVNIIGPSCGRAFGCRQPFIAVPPTHKSLHPTHGKTKAGGAKHGINRAGVPAAFALHDLHFRSPRVNPIRSDEPESHNTDDADGAASGGHDQDDVSIWTGFYVTKRNQDVSILGALYLMYSLIYTPTTQVLWLIANWSLAPPLLFASRALSVTMIALPYTIDTQARYGMAFGKMFGSKVVLPRFVNFCMAVANVVLSVILVVLCYRGLQVSTKSTLKSPAFLVVAFYALLTPIKSLVKMPPKDAGHGGISLSITAFCTCDLRKMLHGGVVLSAMVFLGFITAGPPVGILGSTHFAGWLQEHGHGFKSPDISKADVKSIESWLLCSSDSWWKKAIQIIP